MHLSSLPARAIEPVAPSAGQSASNPSDEAPPRHIRRLRIIAVALTAAYVASLAAVDRPADGYSQWWDGWLAIIATSVPALLLLLRARYPGPRRVVSYLFAMAGLLSVATVANTLFHQRQRPITFPAWSDLLRLSCNVAVTIGLLAMTYRASIGARRRLYLDGLIAGLSATAVVAALFYTPLIADLRDSLPAAIVGLAYPIFDLLHVGLLVGGLSPQRLHLSRPALLIFVAISLVAIGDMLYLRQVAAGSYVGGTLVDAAWPVGFLLIGLAAWASPGRPPRATEGAVATSMTATTVFAVGAFGVLAFARFREVPSLAEFLALAAISLVLVRSLLTVHDIRKLSLLRIEARTDELTGLANRRAFSEALDEQLASLDGAQVAVLVIDLDGFKEINDTLGHDVGDELLIAVTQRMAPLFESTGLLARLGGDEFGAFIHDGTLFEALDAAAAIEAALAFPFQLAGIEVQVGASAGIACCPHHGRERNELLRYADIAMYQAKRRRVGAAVYDIDDDPTDRDNLALVADLRTAVAQRTLVVHLQPIVDLDTDRIVGAEALVRWPHPTRGLISPDHFIGTAERAGLITPITRHVLDAAITHMIRLHRHEPRLRLSVNISGHDLADDDFPATVAEIVGRHHFDPHLLTLEITETVLIADPVRAQLAIDALRATGVRIAIDDFGVGYSSLAQLMELRVDSLKIDKGFVRGLDADPRFEAIVRATIELAAALHLDVVAEGVERESIRDAVRRLGCQVAQGNALAPAMNPDDLLALFELDRRLHPVRAMAGARLV